MGAPRGCVVSNSIAPTPRVPRQRPQISAAALLSSSGDIPNSAGTGCGSPASTSPTALPTMEELVGLCKRRGFVFPSSEIYQGFTGFYDYGPLGVELKNNIKQSWWVAQAWHSSLALPVHSSNLSLSSPSTGMRSPRRLRSRSSSMRILTASTSSRGKRQCLPGVWNAPGK